MLEYQAGVLADYMPYSGRTDEALGRLAGLEPRTLAAMHGSTFVGDGARVLRELNVVMREIFAPHDLVSPPAPVPGSAGAQR